METRIAFFSLMAQVGVTAFALMFATAQYQRDLWATTRLGKLTMTSSLFELFALSIVSIAVVARISYLWQSIALACAVIGIPLTVIHQKAYVGKSRPQLLPIERLQLRLNVLPIISYGAIVVAALASLLGVSEESALGAVSIVVCWFLISGSFETYFTLSPHLLNAEPPSRDERE